MQINSQENSINFKGFKYIPKTTTINKFRRFMMNPADKTTNKIFEKSLAVSRFNVWSIQKELENNIKNVILKPTSKTTTYAWDINPKQSQKYLIFLHGTAQNISNNQLLYEKIISSTNFGILAPEYRGFGKNHNTIISKKTFSQDVNSAYNYLIHKGIQPQNIYSVGHSFGAYPATQLATNNKIHKLILISPIESATNSFKNQASMLRTNFTDKIKFYCKKPKIFKWYLENLFNIKKLTKKCKVPVDIIHSREDNFINNGEFYKIARSCKNLHNVVILPGGSHRLESSKIDELIKILNEGV